MDYFVAGWKGHHRLLLETEKFCQGTSAAGNNSLSIGSHHYRVAVAFYDKTTEFCQFLK
jgi:hypothetical protein